ncbi:DUF3105 domain-containing protein [Blastococcus mobilis]|uniref:DUF3105 domain-containing protein n=1 Tax=Blastococcus mobilis TaxID=1938746 RepID=A0A238WDY4_9ACTN|nr:DUF3105 domain-containing protein [Blastococcus mobilis]SNR44792.1 Protein of unknown function [Blastococcus mobilis]
MAKDRKPATGNGRPAGKRAPAGKGGRTRPAANVVAPQRPWGLIAAAVAVVVFAAAVITYAVIQVNRSKEDEVQSIDEIDGVQTFDYAAGQEHVTTEVDYTESPPVGGPHDGNWADCTGTVYDVDIRHENAVHGLEHGAVWITYNPDRVSDGDIAKLADLVEGENGRMLSPYAGLDSPISLQSWNHQLKVDSADDIRIEQFADFLTFRAGEFPEPGASCENPAFAADPLTEADSSTPIGPSDMPTAPTPSADPTETSAP